MSQLNPSEISSVLKEKIAGLDLSAERKNEGIVVSVSDGIVRICLLYTSPSPRD